MKPDLAPNEELVREIGRRILKSALAPRFTLFQGDWLIQWMMKQAMRDARLQARLFRVVDVLPTLKTPDQVVDHVREYLAAPEKKLPFPLTPVLRSNNPLLLRGTIAAVTRWMVGLMAHRFIAAETISRAPLAVQSLQKRCMAYTVDILGEETTSESQADEYMRRYLELIDALTLSQLNPGLPQHDLARGSGNSTSRLPPVNVSIKLSALDSHFDPIDPDRSLHAVGKRLKPILQLAHQRGAGINIDMEHYEEKSLILYIFKSILMEPELREFRGAGIAMQAYLMDTAADLENLLEWTRQRGIPIAVRLVKGAYWDIEMIRAIDRGWPSPVFSRKWETDVSFERLSAFLIHNREWLHPIFASHNARSLAVAIAWAQSCGLAPQDIEMQMLFGMGDSLKAVLVEQGFSVRVYAPVGPLIPGMGYLIRRLLENTSNDSFLRHSFGEHAPLDELLANPSRTRPASAALPAPINIDPPEYDSMLPPFTNEPASDFSLESSRAAMRAAIQEIRSHRGGQSYPLVIAGKRNQPTAVLDSVDPSHPDFIVGRVGCASKSDAGAAVKAAKAAWPEWRTASVDERAALLRRVAAELRRRRFELAAWMCLESGKPWREADGDVSEAIDYCEFYAREALRLTGRLRQRLLPGEQNVLVYESRGVAAIISPWNFPLAILAGMTTAALVMGNTVIMKPAEQSPVIAFKFFEILEAAGIPPGVANYLPGRGVEAGAALVAHQDVSLIAFTGSRNVGLQIMRAAAEVVPGQRHVKKVIAEMGGKNAIIVDEDAEIDEAVIGVATSAFGYAGQKCSACSRVITVSSIHDSFVARLVETVRSLPIGPAEDPGVIVGPLIEAKARDRVLSYIEKGRSEGEIALEIRLEQARPESGGIYETGKSRDLGNGFFVGPVIFDRVAPNALIAQEEIFGPVLCVIEARTFEQALEIANASDYALTGGVYSRHPAHIKLARQEFRAGNLYINRPITGAIVDRQPFGGYKLSGVDSKAGGPDYLLQFCQPRTITENTIRHGFAASSNALE
jgi:RHH-type transcriptional regulator, proline utilization regulon repressor / proline dehydrogenase / delta 1-pyrroline-5-carboxylate dehydrogenase